VQNYSHTFGIAIREKMGHFKDGIAIREKMGHFKDEKKNMHKKF